MEMVSHINRRIRTNSNIKLPVDNLLTLFCAPTSTGYVVVSSLEYCASLNNLML